MLRAKDIKAFCLNDTEVMEALNPFGVHTDTRTIVSYLEKAIDYLKREERFYTPYQVVKRSRRPYLTNVQYKKGHPIMVKVYFPYALVDWEWFDTFLSLNPKTIVKADQICNCPVGFIGRRIIF